MRKLFLILSFFLFAGSSLTVVPVSVVESDIFFVLGQAEVSGSNASIARADHTRDGWSSYSGVKKEVHTRYKLQFSIGQEVKAQRISEIIPTTIGKNKSAVTFSPTYGDLFWVFGDSFAAGSNNTTGAGPNAAPNNYYRTSDNTFQSLTSDIPGASNGSPWPQFANDYYTATGRKVAIIPNGVGGTKFFDTWNGTSAAYLAAKQDANDAMGVAGVTRLKGIIIICGVNDARGGDGIAAIGASIGNLFYQLDIDFPNTQIYVVMLGYSSTNGNRLVPVRGYVRDQVRKYTNAQIVCQLQAIHEWTPPAGSPGGYYSLDNLHLNQTGNNLLGTMINRYMQLPVTYSKYARAIYNSYYSTLSLSQLATIDAWVTAYGSQYHTNVEGFWNMKAPDKNDIYVDYAHLSTPVDDGFVFTANSFITTNTAQTIKINLSINNASGWTATDLGLFVATADRKGAFGTTTKYLAGASSGSNSLGMGETPAGALQWFLYDNNTSSLGSGGFADDTEYGIGRVGDDKKRYVNGVLIATVTVAPSAALTAGVEVGGRSTSGIVLELNTEIPYFGWIKCSGWDPLIAYNANVALKTNF